MGTKTKIKHWNSIRGKLRWKPKWYCKKDTKTTISFYRFLSDKTQSWLWFYCKKKIYSHFIKSAIYKTCWNIGIKQSIKKIDINQINCLKKEKYSNWCAIGCSRYMYLSVSFDKFLLKPALVKGTKNNKLKAHIISIYIETAINSQTITCL